jgi:hypothetical protein
VGGRGGPGSGAVLHVGQHLHAVAVERRARPPVAGQGERRLARGLDPPLRLDRVRIDGNGALLAVHQDYRPLGDLGQAADAHHAGQAELSGDDRGVACRTAESGGQRDDPGRIQAGGVGRREVVGEQHRRRLGHRDAGLPLPGQLGHDAIADVPDVGRALGHHAAQAGEQLDELLRRPDRRHLRRGAVADSLLDGGEQAAVTGQLRGRVEHLRADAGRRGGPRGQSFGNGFGGCGEPVLLGRTLLLGDPRPLGGRQLDHTDRTHDGADRHPGNHRRPGQYGPTRQGLRGEPGTGRGGGHGWPHCLLGPGDSPSEGRTASWLAHWRVRGCGESSGAATMVLLVTRVTKED